MFKFNKKTNFPFTIHPLFLVVGVYCFFVKQLPLFFCYTLSALVHEGGHFLVARKYGYKMLKVRLMPYGAELCGDLDEFIYNDEIKIALAGPITSVLMSGVIVMTWWMFPSVYNFTIELCMASLACGIFNLLPIYPLDGGRVLTAILSKKETRKSAILKAKIATRAFAVLLFILFIISYFYYFNLSFGLMAVMLFLSSFSKNEGQNYQRLLFNDFLHKPIKQGLEMVELMVDKNLPVYKIYPKLKSQKFYRFIVVDESMNMLFVCDEKLFYKLNAEDFKLSFGELKKLNIT